MEKAAKTLSIIVLIGLFTVLSMISYGIFSFAGPREVNTKSDISEIRNTAPELELLDTNANGADKTDEYAGGIASNMTSTTEDTEVSDILIYNMRNGTKYTAIQLDGSTYTAINNLVTAFTTQTVPVTTDVDSFAIGNQFSRSIVFLAGDNDSDNDEIDLQDGTVDGQIVIFIVASGCDADDTLTVDVEEDSTCTGCPNAGVYAFDDPGDMCALVWNNSASAWFHLNTYTVD